jgi:ATP-dependent RNA helicase RhlE
MSRSSSRKPRGSAVSFGDHGVSFTQLGLSDPIVQGVRALGFSEPTPIQRRAIPLIMTGRDLVGSAQTGTGKTAAFVLPILMRLGTHGEGLRALILVPTAELAVQVDAHARACARFTRVRADVVSGGAPIGPQERMLRDTGTDLLIATPGRLLDLHHRQSVSFEDIQVVVLDDPDRMVDMGLAPQLRRILRLLPRARQTLMFSTTMPAQLNEVAGEGLASATRLEIAAVSQAANGSAPPVEPARRERKSASVGHRVGRAAAKKSIVFPRPARPTARTKPVARTVAGSRTVRGRRPRSPALARRSRKRT